MMPEINEPDNRPKERIEKLISKNSKNRNRRIHSRALVEPGTEIYFPLVCKGEVMDVSEDGISIRFKPSDSPTLDEDQSIALSMSLESHSFKISASVKRIESRFGVIVLGLSFDPDDIELMEDI